MSEAKSPTKFEEKRGLPSSRVNSPTTEELPKPTYRDPTQDIEEVLGILAPLRNTPDGETVVVHTILDAVNQITDPPTVRATINRWFQRRKEEDGPEDAKFSDGIANARGANTPEQIVKVNFYDATYRPPMGVDDLFSDIATWTTPLGVLWNQKTIEDLKGNADLILAHHSDGQPAGVVVPLYLYSASQKARRQVWAAWIVPPEDPSKARWKVVRNQELEDTYRSSGGAPFNLDPAWFAEFGLLQGTVPEFAVQMSSMDGVCGDPFPEEFRDGEKCDFRICYGKRRKSLTVTTSVAQNDFFLVRYESKCRGDPKWSPVWDTVAWLPRPVSRNASSTPRSSSARMLEASPGVLPPFGVLEYLYSRGAEEEIVWPKDKGGWTCRYALGQAAQLLIDKCFAEPDQQAYNGTLHDEYKALVKGLTHPESDVSGVVAALAGWAKERGSKVPSESDMVQEIADLRERVSPKEEMFDIKLGASRSAPPPSVLAHALEVQLLEWNGRRHLVAISGTNQCCTSCDGKVVELSRVIDTFDDQIFWHLNRAMRMKQFGTEPYLDINSDAGLDIAGKYLAPPQPQVGTEIVEWDDKWDGADDDASVGAARASAAVFSRTTSPNHTAKWNGSAWEVHKAAGGVTDVLSQHVWFELGTWLLPQVTPLIYYIDSALRKAKDLPGSRAPSGLKTYRGLKGVALPRSIYDLSKVVLWGAYSSTSGDRGIASSFAKGDDTKAAVFSLTGASCVCIAQWSRFGREREWLYPPNSTFQVTSTLDDEQAEILGLKNLQLFSMKEVSEMECLLIFLRALVNMVVATVQGALMPKHVEQVFRIMKCLGSGVNPDLDAALRITCDPDGLVLPTSEGQGLARMLVRLGANKSVFGEIARRFQQPDVRIMVLLVQAGAAFSGADSAMSWMEEYNEKNRSNLDAVAMIELEELQMRCKIEEEEFTGEGCWNDMVVTTDRALAEFYARITAVQVTGLQGTHAHMNGKYFRTKPMVVRVDNWPGHPSPEEVGLTFDEERAVPFITAVSPDKSAYSCGLRSGMRVVFIGNPNELLFTREDAINALRNTRGQRSVEFGVETEISFELSNPIRLLSFCHITLDVQHDMWRLEDMEMRNNETLRSYGWEHWRPVGMYGFKKASQWRSREQWLLGNWVQDPQYYFYWEYGEEEQVAPICNGGMNARGIFLNEGIQSVLEEEPSGLSEGEEEEEEEEEEEMVWTRMTFNDTQLMDQLFAQEGQRKMETTDLFAKDPRMSSGGSLFLVDCNNKDDMFVIDVKRHIKRRLRRCQTNDVFPRVVAFAETDSQSTSLISNSTIYVPTPNEAGDAGLKEASAKALRFIKPMKKNVTKAMLPFNVQGSRPYWKSTRGTGKTAQGRRSAGICSVRSWSHYVEIYTPARYLWYAKLNFRKRVEPPDVRIAIPTEKDMCRAERRNARHIAEKHREFILQLHKLTDENDKYAKECTEYQIKRCLRDHIWRIVDIRDTFKRILRSGVCGGRRELAELGEKSEELIEEITSSRLKELFEKRDLDGLNALLVKLHEPAEEFLKYRNKLDKYDAFMLGPQSVEELQTLPIPAWRSRVLERKKQPKIPFEPILTQSGDRGLLTLCIGQAGCQIGEVLTELYAAEHNVGLDGVGPQDVNPLVFTDKDGVFCPRVLFVDSEPNTILKLRRGRCRGLITEDNSIHDSHDANDNYAMAYFQKKALQRQTAERLRIMSEECERIAGFHVIHATGGGTGSGVTVGMLEKINRSWPKVSTQAYTVLPGTVATGSITADINSILAFHSLSEHTGLSTFFDNARLNDICANYLGLRDDPHSLYYTNSLISQVISATTASMRFSRKLGDLRMDIGDMQTNMVPYPRIHYLMPSYCPILKRGLVSDASVYQLTSLSYNPNLSMMPSMRGIGLEYYAKTKIISSALLFRGEDIAHSEVLLALEAIKTSRHLNYLDWAPVNHLTAITSKSPTVLPTSGMAKPSRALVHLCNCIEIGTFCETLLKRATERRHHVIRYVTQGMEEGALYEALEDVAATVKDYEEIGQETMEDFPEEEG